MIAKYHDLCLRALSIRASGQPEWEKARQWTAWVEDLVTAFREDANIPARKQPQREPIPCAGCGAEFTPHTHDQRYCSSSCAGRAGWQAMQAKRLEKTERNGHEPKPEPEPMPTLPEPVKVAPALKRCTKCKEAKPITDFGPDNKSRDGLRYECRSCVAAASIARYHQTELTRECPICHQTYTTHMRKQRYCSRKCAGTLGGRPAQKAHRAKQEPLPEPQPDPVRQEETTSRAEQAQAAVRIYLNKGGLAGSDYISKVAGIYKLASPIVERIVRDEMRRQCDMAHK